MNTKKVKALRKQVKYHPKQERNYIEIVVQKKMLNVAETVKQKNPVHVLVNKVTLELDPKCSRFMYQQLKQEMKNA